MLEGFVTLLSFLFRRFSPSHFAEALVENLERLFREGVGDSSKSSGGFEPHAVLLVSQEGDEEGH